MGQEVQCRARVNGAVLEGRLKLETDELIFRDDSGARLQMLLTSVTQARADAGWLELERHAGATTVAFELGARAERWADRILHPPSVLDKLGIHAAVRVAGAGRSDPWLQRQLAAVGAELAPDGGSADIVVLGVEESAALDEVAVLARTIGADSALWVVYPKGRRDLKEADVIAAGRDAGLVDVKVVRYSDAHTALKFVRPRDKRRP